MKTYKQLQERINMAKAKMGDVIKDFQDSDAPQFKGKSQEKRRQMAIAAKMAAEEVELEEGRMKEIAMDINSMDDKEFKAKHKKSKQEMKDSLTSKEEVEQIDELSSSTLDSYQDKANSDRNKRIGIWKRGGKHSEGSEKQKSNYAKMQNRTTGMRLAAAKTDHSPAVANKTSKGNLLTRARVKATEETNLEESDLKPFIVVHAKHGKFETHAASTYEAAKNAAAHWKTKKGTAGMDVHRADITHSTQHVG